MRAIIKSISYFFFIFLLTGIFSCGDLNSGESNSGGLKVKGQLGNGYSFNTSKSSGVTKLFTAGAFVDKVVAVPINTPFIATPDIMKNAVTAPVLDDGSFEISFDNTKNWILILIDSTLPQKDQIVSFAALGDSSAGSDSMILLPVSEAVSDIDMGTLEVSGDEGVQTGSMADNQTNFSLNLSELRQIAKNDNILKTIKNIYVNYDTVTEKFYSALMVFWWDADAALSKNNFSNPEDYKFSGYQPSFNSRNDTTFPYEGVLNKSFIVKIVPPEPVTDSNNNIWNYFSNECDLTEEDRGTNKLFAGSNTPPFAFGVDTSNGWIQMSAGGCRFKNLIDGWWSVQKDGIEKAAFDLSVCSPISSVTGKPYVYLPSLKVNVDELDNVISLEVKWYIYNSEIGQYEEVTDIEGFKNLMEWVGLGFNDWQTPGNSECFDFSNVTTTKFYPKIPWKLTGNASGAYDIGSIILGYRIYGVDFDVDFRPVAK